MSAHDGFAHFDIAVLAAKFPDTAETMLLDHYLTDAPDASTRLFRVYRATPAHFHKHCDERLFVVQGRGRFWAGSPQNEVEFGPGTLLVFPRLAVHAMPVLLEEPLVFLAIDTPRRDPKDVHFVDPAEGSAESFIRRQ